MVGTRRIGALVLCVVLGVCLCARESSGQLTGGLSNIQVAPVTSRHVASLVEYFGLDAETASVVEGLHADVVDRHARALVTLQEMMEAAQEEAQTGTPDVRADVQLQIMKKLREFRLAMEGSRDGFFESVKVVLPEEALARWDGYERRYRREALVNIDSGLYNGAAVDLVGLVETMELDAESFGAVESLLARYEVELDAVVVERIGMVDRFALRQIEEVEEKGNDPVASMAMYREVYAEGSEAALKTVGINDRFARLIGDALPEGMGVAFERAYREAVFPAIYRETAADAAFSAVLGLEDLTEEQRGLVVEIRERYDRESAAVESSWAEAVRAHQAAMTLDDVWSGQMAPAEAREYEASRRGLGSAAVDRLREVLSESQRSVLPEATDWRERGLPG